MVVSRVSDIVRINGSGCGQSDFEDAVRRVVTTRALALHSVQEVVEYVHVLTSEALSECRRRAPGPGRPLPRFAQRLRTQQGTSTFAEIVIVHRLQDLTWQCRCVTATPYLDGRGHQRCAPGVAGSTRVSVGAPGIFPLAHQLRPGCPLF